MEFKRFSAGPFSYGSLGDAPPEVEYAPGVTNVNFYDENFTEHINNEEHENHASLKEFIEALGICHTVLDDKKKDKDGNEYIVYNASSPDELALVNGARHLGFAYQCRD